jgi:hypothetical protein
LAGLILNARGPHNILRTRLRAAFVYTYIVKGRLEFIRTPLFTNKYV